MPLSLINFEREARMNFRLDSRWSLSPLDSRFRGNDNSGDGNDSNLDSSDKKRM